MALAFERQGYFCDQAADGVEADDHLADVDYDVLITDLRMPNRHGYSLVTEVLCRPTRPLIVVYTAVDDPRMMRDLLQRGVDDVLIKPLDCGLVVAKVSTMLDDRPVTKALR